MVAVFLPFASALVGLAFHHYGGSPNNIRLYQEERVARNFGLTGFSLQPTYSWLGIGSTNVLGRHHLVNMCTSSFAL
jgi:hypothetical protein